MNKQCTWGKLSAIIIASLLASGCALWKRSSSPKIADTSAPDAPLNWRALDRHQHTMTRAEFETLLAQRYAPGQRLDASLRVTDKAVTVFASPEQRVPLWTLFFKRPSPGNADIKDISTPSTRSIETILDGAAAHKSLSGLLIALDPGHIGGDYARMEERFFVPFVGARPVQEAAANLIVAHLLKEKFEKAGATVRMVKDGFEPVTKQRPEDFRAQAAQDVERALRGDAAEARMFASMHPLEQTAYRADRVRKRMELLFYRSAEIRARAERQNAMKPHLTLCIHFDAKGWDDDGAKFTDDNRLVVFVHGNYLAGELEGEEGKRALFSKLLEGSAAEEMRVADAVSRSLARATGLSPVGKQPADGSSGWLSVSEENPYLYARNLAANRLYYGPVVYLEPYYQNNRVVYERLLAGDYEGERMVAGEKRRSIFREYADAVAEGVINAFRPTP